MKALKPLVAQKSGKHDREMKILIGLIEHYLKTGKPVGSNTLKETGFEDLSSATIRNYFANLENEGYLTQQHSSGGRIPTEQAYRFYAEEFKDAFIINHEDEQQCDRLRTSENREIAAYLQQAAETLSSLTQSAVFLSAPRFDQDIVVDMKIVGIDSSRYLSILVTDFGVIQTELLQMDKKLSAFALKRIEEYFHWRLTGHGKPENLESEEESLAQKIYNELMVRYIVGYSNFTNDEVYRTGFSKLLAYPEFQEAQALAGSLSLFENPHSMRLLLKECSKQNNLKFWIGKDLASYLPAAPNCSVLAVPYRVGPKPVGAVGVLGPIRMPYRCLFGILKVFGECISEALTRNLYKFKIKYRQPEEPPLYLQKEEHRLLGQSRLFLIEDLRDSNIHSSS